MLFEVALLAMTSPQAGNSGQSNVQSVTTPKPIEGMWAFYRVGDTPVNADGSAKHGVVRIAITIDAAGIPQSCKIVISSGDRTLDKSSCLSALARGKFLPAKDEQSRSITSVLPTTVTWGAAPRGSQDAELSRADAVFSVERLPNGESLEFEIFEIVDSTGAQLSCGSDNDSVDVRYKNAACKSISTLKNRLSGFVGQPPNKIMIVSRVLFTTKPISPSKRENGRIYNVERQN